MSVQCSVFTKYMYMVVELVQGKGAPANYYSEVKDREYEEEVKEVEEDEVMDGGETFPSPGVQKEENDPEEYKDMRWERHPTSTSGHQPGTTKPNHPADTI